jgi:hypothetical protein
MVDTELMTKASGKVTVWAIAPDRKLMNGDAIVTRLPAYEVAHGLTDHPGKMATALFSGPDAKKRAMAYYEWVQSEQDIEDLLS